MDPRVTAEIETFARDLLAREEVPLGDELDGVAVTAVVAGAVFHRMEL
jgi:hypothetical protein